MEVVWCSQQSGINIFQLPMFEIRLTVDLC